MSEPGATFDPSDPPSRRRPTMKDVADKVGMSRQLVSIVLRGVSGASDDSRRRILAAARELGYHPDASAQMLRRRRSGLLGVVFTMHQPFEIDLVEALYRSAERRGYRIALSTTGPGRSHQTAVDELMRQRIEALLVLTTGGESEFIDDLPTQIPLLLLGGPRSTMRHDTVRVRNGDGIALAVDYLADLGHRSISYVGPRDEPNAAERLEGYREAMKRRQRESQIDVVASTFTETGGHEAARQLLTRGAHPTALVCGNDRCAFGVLETLVRAGIRVPQDISVVGFDDSTVARLPFADLTTVRVDTEQMAERALAAIHDRLSVPSRPDSVATVSPTLIVRQSTAPPLGEPPGR